MARTGRNKGTGLLTFVFLLPLVAIIIFALRYSSQIIVLKDVTKVSINAPGQSVVTYDSDEDIEFFVNVLKSSLSISTEMRDVSNEQPVRIVFNREDKGIEYKFYPSLDLSGCLLIDPDGDLYVLENEKAGILLLRPEFDYLYSDYFLPKLNVVSGSFISEAKPVESTWTYVKSDGETYNYTPAEYAGENDVCTIYKGLENSLVFDLLPEDDSGPEIVDMTCVSADGSEFNIRTINDLTFSTDRMLKLSFTAKWSGRNGARAYGEARYVINLRYDIPAELTINGGEYTVGDVVVINATHLNPDEAISFQSILEIPRVEFGMTSEEKGTGVALLPIGLSTMSGVHTVKLDCGGNSITEDLYIAGIPSDGFDMSVVVPIEDYQSRFTPEKIQSFFEEIKSVGENRPQTNHFVYGEGGFEKPVGYAPVLEFGKTVNLAAVGNESNDSGNRTSYGLVYELPEGTNIHAVQAGEVVFSGNLETTGNTVVLYHGYGVYSYYYHLSDLGDNGVGKIYNKNETVGFAGTLYEGSEQHVLSFAMSIDGVFVNPSWFID